jgi:pimeloyl-ACP methyl ester carboxylesterase
MSAIQHPAQEMDIPVRGLRYRVHCWGDPDSPPVFLLHGWADTGLSFQFLAEQMASRWRLIAPDWRGFGDSDRATQGYWFPDYLADLDALLDHFAPSQAVRLVGHSMGGNVVWLYAGAMPERVSHVVSLDAFGLRDSNPDDAPARYRQWLDEWRETQSFADVSGTAALMERVRKLAPRLDEERLRFVAESWIRTLPDGMLELKHDPAHKRVNPVLFRRNELRACWRRITAKTLLVLPRDSRFYDMYRQEGIRADCREHLPGLQEAIVEQSGHMVHLEQPEELARLLDEFLR